MEENYLTQNNADFERGNHKRYLPELFDQQNNMVDNGNNLCVIYLHCKELKLCLTLN